VFWAILEEGFQDLEDVWREKYHRYIFAFPSQILILSIYGA